MAQTKTGAVKMAAQKIGISLEEYKANLAQMKKWCYLCEKWHHISNFGIDNSRYDGLTAACRVSRNKKARNNYMPKQETVRRGRRYTKARDGDKKQARARVNHLVDVGLLDNPNKVACVDCGHLGNDRRHEYDHFNGYDADSHEAIEVVCSVCHHARHPKNRERDELGRFK